MRLLKFIGGSLLAVLPLASGAAELQMEPHAMIYYQVPFAAGDQKVESTFGLRLDRAIVDRNDGIEYRQLLQRPALMDVQFTPRGMQHLSLAGTDYLKLYRVRNAAEEGATEDSSAKPAAAPPAGSSAKPASTPPAGQKAGMSKVLDEANPGFIIGAGFLVLVVVGVSL